MITPATNRAKTKAANKKEQVCDSSGSQNLMSLLNHTDQYQSLINTLVRGYGKTLNIISFQSGALKCFSEVTGIQIPFEFAFAVEQVYLEDKNLPVTTQKVYKKILDIRSRY